ncbi:hypothetical protein [Sphaerisporangium sp. NPDC051011]|uniref:hypothetical protein n=1 Tax=Sphaerisporangium sp. NPDC051011 TaxID=3155792 RepID=UPI0033F21B4F
MTTESLPGPPPQVAIIGAGLDTASPRFSCSPDRRSGCGIPMRRCWQASRRGSTNTEQQAPGLVRELCEQGEFGAKSGRGIFPWPGRTRDDVEARLLAHLLEQARRPATGS